MPMMEGTSRLKTWTGEYSFAVDGGGTGTKVLRSNDGPIPIGSVIEGGYLEVSTILASSGSATGALTVEGANDVVSATAFDGAPFSSTGRKSVIPAFTGATTLKTSAARSPSFVIGTAALTGGVFTLVLYYK